MRKLVRLTNLAGHPFYMGKDWVIRPHYINPGKLDIKGSQVVHAGVTEYAEETVDVIMARVEASTE